MVFRWSALRPSPSEPALQRGIVLDVAAISSSVGRAMHCSSPRPARAKDVRRVYAAARRTSADQHVHSAMKRMLSACFSSSITA
jgi:hypothetical protein